MKTIEEAVADPRAVFSVPEVGELLGIGRGSAYAAAQRGEIPVLALGRRCVVPKASLLSLLGVDHSMAGNAPSSDGRR